MTSEIIRKINDIQTYRLHFKDDFWREIAVEICRRHRLPCANPKRAAEGENIIFFIDDRFIIKIYPSFCRNGYEPERAALEFCAGKISITTPEILLTGEFAGWSYIVMTQISGTASRELWAKIENRKKFKIISQLGEAMRELHSVPAPLEQFSLNRNWQEYIRQKAETAVERQKENGANPEWLESLPSYIADRIDLLPVDFKGVFLHGDIHAGNLLLVQKGEQWQINGLIDFGDSFCGFHEYEFVTPGVLMVQGNRELQREMFLAYGYRESELGDELRSRLMLLTIFYECADLRKYALRLSPEAVNYSLEELAGAIWKF